MLISDEIRRQLGRFPRLDYGSYPTPLERLDNLTRDIGGPHLWIKRDDEIGPAMGGNKGRKLEFLMADVQQNRKKKVVTFGGLQSNHARMTAAASASLGLECHLFYFEKRPSEFRGNLLLNRLFGARLHFLPLGSGGDGSMTIERTNQLVKMVSLAFTGPGTYFIPVGGHNVTGCLGYVNAALELQEQIDEIGLDAEKTTVILACGTGGTLAGLLAGFSLLNSPIQVLGIDVGKLWKAFPNSLAHLIGQLCQAVGGDYAFRAEDIPIIEGKYVGPKYAAHTAAATKAIEKMARSEGILLDPIYTGKAFAGLLDLVVSGRFSSNHHLIFLHTGGGPGLWAFGQRG